MATALLARCPSRALLQRATGPRSKHLLIHRVTEPSRYGPGQTRNSCSQLTSISDSNLSLSSPHYKDTMLRNVRDTVHWFETMLMRNTAFPAHTVISMPALSPTMQAGNIGAWQKQPGDTLAPGDVLVEIETDKAQMDFEFQEEGTLAKILKESGEKDIAVGSVRTFLKRPQFILKTAIANCRDGRGRGGRLSLRVLHY